MVERDFIKLSIILQFLCGLALEPVGLSASGRCQKSSRGEHGQEERTGNGASKIFGN
jgi:hypothetical protein